VVNAGGCCMGVDCVVRDGFESSNLAEVGLAGTVDP